jgi:transposase
LRLLLQAVEHFEQHIAKLAPTLRDYQLFASFPGAGPTFAPRLLVAFGEQRERYSSPDQLQRYAGIAPVTERSGNKSWVHRGCGAPSSCARASRSAPLCRSRIAIGPRPTTNSSALAVPRIKPRLRALAFKWIRIAYRCRHNRTTYGEATYLNALKRRKPPLLN